MTSETRKRIEAYQRALPNLRERVIAVALLLAMSVSMLVTASFAWLTISINPEATNVSTTVAANGNLEIALATSTTPPGESAVGDSSSAQDVTKANITWGNLVNLSDDSYGLQNLTLRPARLNTDALLTSPLFSAVYTSDGRVEKLTSNFDYTSWVPATDKVEGYFSLADQLGVRAISSTKLDALSASDQVYVRYLELKDAAESANSEAAAAFEAITSNETWMELLAKVIGFHMCATLEPSNPDYYDKQVTKEEVQALMAMYDAFVDACEKEASAMATLMNFQLYAIYGGDETKYTPYTETSILTCMDKSQLKKDGTTDLTHQANGFTATITDIETFLYDYYMLCEDRDKLADISEGSQLGWTSSGLKAVINHLVDINKCLITKGSETNTVAGLLNTFMGGMSGYTAAMGYMNKEVTATITNGVLYNFEQRVGSNAKITTTTGNYQGYKITAGMYVDSMSMAVEANVYATIVTSATTPSTFAQDLTNAVDTIEFQATTEIVLMAQDTYALAVDLWVRTNASDSYLTLEGNVLTESHEEPAMAKNANGEEVQLYTLTRTEEVEIKDESGETTSETTTVTTTYDLYKETQEVTSEGGTTSTVETWYRADTFTAFELKDGETPIAKMETVTTVIGFEGENRIWDTSLGANSMISTDATTQGSGSCYVYYADTPEDMARSMELLKAMHVAFIDANGKLLASATMDTDQSFEESGRVIVPLVLDADSLNVGTEDEPLRVITKLTKNEPMRITALVYLDGTMLTNENVLSAAEIQGQLNIQFGSSTELEPIRNETLESAERSVSASVSDTKFNYDTDTNLNTTVRINVTGDEPNAVTAFFLRKINDTQGSRETVMNFVKNVSTGVWECEYTFTAPGTYILRTVQLDGQEYVLKDIPEVVVEGFTIESLACTQSNENRNINIMTAASSSSVDLRLKFATNDVSKMPTSVQGRFLRDDGTAVNINFTYNASGSNAGYWTGSATFLASGDYTFQYVVLDGEYTELPEGLPLTASVTLGMRVAVWTTSPIEFKFLPSEMDDNMKRLAMQVKIYNNSGKEMIGLQNAVLTYRLSTSSVNTIDTDLTWDAASGYYVGELLSEEASAGKWVFSKVEVGSNTLTNATTSPTFTLISPEPPSFVSMALNPGYTFAPESDAKMQAYIKYSATAKTQAVIVDRSGNEYLVTGSIANTDTDTNVTTWNFAIPKNTSGTQDGYWTMKELRIWDYYDEAGNWITATVNDDGTLDGAYMTVEKVADTDYTIKVVETVNVTFPDVEANETQTFNGTFLEEHEISGVNVTITDFEGKALQGVKNVSLNYSYDGQTEQNGGYESNEVSAIGEGGAFTISFAQDATDKTRFVQSNELKVQFAGKYEPYAFSFQVGDSKTYPYGGTSTNALPNGVPSFTVTSTTPTVTVTAISPRKGDTHRINTTALTNYTYASDSPSFITGDFYRIVDDYTAAVYIYTENEFSIAGTDVNKHNVTEPTVTLTLSDVPSGVTYAYMRFENASNSEYPAEFDFDVSTMKATASIGKCSDGSVKINATDEGATIYYAGTQTQDTITITIDNAVTYTIRLDNPITIIEPQYPASVTYQVDADTFEESGGVLPDPVYGYDDQTVTVTLPTGFSWYALNDGATETVGTYVTVSDETVEDIAYYRYYNYSNRKYNYRVYDERTLVECAPLAKSGTGTIWTVTKWEVNGEVYDAGTVLVDLPNGTVIEAYEWDTSTGDVTVNMFRVKTTVTYPYDDFTTQPSIERVYLEKSDKDPTYYDTYEDLRPQN